MLVDPGTELAPLLLPSKIDTFPTSENYYRGDSEMAKRTVGPKRAVKATTKKRSVNAGKPGGTPPRGAPTTDQDPKRRLGNFTGTGEAPRKGHRTTGINGPQKKQAAAKRANKKGD